METVMPERIRYTWSQSTLGEFMVAASENGVVALEFADRREEALAALRSRLPEAVLERDEEGLSALVVRLRTLIDRPDGGQDVAIDPRGDDYQKKVWSLLREIPAGETTSYGALAARVGTRDARDVTAAIASNTIAILIPCHRVVKRDGALSGYRWGAKRKRALLDRERRAASFQLA
jgi:AraC family transcriptional regulator of adaptative response/methylated-DNA-[protein]-cysteine methyltransferase